MSSDAREIPAIVTTDLSTNGVRDHDDINEFSMDRRQDNIDGISSNQIILTNESSLVPPTSGSPSSTLSPGQYSSQGLTPHGHTAQGHARRPSDPTLLSPSPILKNRTSLEVPHHPPSPSLHSPTSTFGAYSDGASVPPSPTLSARSSVHFATSTALRDNKPEDVTGLTSLSMLDGSVTSDKHGSHSRRPSVITVGSGEGSVNETVPDHGGQIATLDNTRTRSETESHHTSMTLASPTNTHVDTRRTSKTQAELRRVGSAESQSTRKDKGKQRDVQMEAVDPATDETDCAPFAEKPLKLASLVDPKNVALLKEMGGIEGVLKGLGTHRTRGLGSRALRGGGEEKRSPGAGRGTGQRHDRDTRDISDKDDQRKDEYLLTPTTSLEDDLNHERDGPYSATLDDRHRVYGRNVLPGRPSKSLLMLMWLALKDKVLVRC